MTDTAPPFALYNPALLPPEVLLSEFTARRPLLATLLDIVRSNHDGEPVQHAILVGRRGMGKTTLLCAVSASIITAPEGSPNADLRKFWQPVIFDEESRRIGDLADFWLECIRQWEAATNPALTTASRADALLDLSGDVIEDRSREEFLKLVDQSGKRALLLIDNINDIFAAISDHESLMRLRSFLMADSRVMIIGAATQWFSDVTNVDKPFFEFFREFDLKALSLVEMRECLAGVATARGDQRVLNALEERSRSIEALHILTGGNPRLIRTFYRLLNEGMHGELRQQLQRLIDDYTPYHKAIIDALPGQQQRVLDAIALHWNPCDVATVARQTRLPSNQVSAQIRALTKAGLVGEVAALGTQKKKAYLLADRFSNIHYLMRHGRTGQRRMHWFVMTLRVLFDDAQFAEAAARTARLTAQGDGAHSDDALAIAHESLHVAGTESARRLLFDRLAGSPGFDAHVDPDFAEQFCREAIAKNPNDAVAHHKLGRTLHVFREQLHEAEAAYRRAIALDSEFAWPWNNLGNLLSDLDRKDEAEAAYRRAIELDPKYAPPWNGLGNLLSDLGRKDEAEAAYRQLIELDPEDALPCNNLGNLLSILDRKSEAEAAYRQAIELDPKYARPWYNLGVLLSDLGRKDEAEVAYRQAIELDLKYAPPWNGLGNLLSDLDRKDEAEAAYRQAIELNPKDALPHSNLALLLSGDPMRQVEAQHEAATGLRLNPNGPRMQHLFESLCFADESSLRELLPLVSAWANRHPEDQWASSTSSFLHDAWIAFARIATSEQALALLQAQSENVQQMLESLSDVFQAHMNREHLHRLAPERRSVVLRLLERLT
jgi:Flp pilus assembly protein TadD